jgi:nitrite reductase/ring-hydroxylating ferredoxin subunit
MNDDMQTMNDKSQTELDCDESQCAISPSRRRFLRDSFLAVAGALVAVGVSQAEAFAMPLELVSARGQSGASRTYAIPPNDGAQIDHANDVILVRWQGVAYAFNLSCPHQNTALRWSDGDGQFQCPKHHSRYRPDGSFIEGRATRGMDRFAIRLEGSSIAVDVDTLYQQDTNPDPWNAAMVKLT